MIAAQFQVQRRRAYAATRSISAESSFGARELFTRRDNGHTCK